MVSKAGKIQKRRTPLTPFDVVNFIIMLAVLLIMLYPLLNVLAISLSSTREIVLGNIGIIPKGINILGYRLLAKSQQIFIAYKNTILYTVTYTILVVAVCSFTAYPLAIKKFQGRKVITIFVTIPFFIQGGLIPTFILVKNLGLYNTMWAVVLPTVFSTWYIILFRTNFQTLPESLRESAYMDGANDIRIWWQVFMPLSKPIIATISIFAAVSMWNSFFAPYIYLNDPNKFPLQIILRKLLLQGNMDEVGVIAAVGPGEGLVEEGVVELLKNVATIVTIGPIILVYPFFQRYFTKGVLVGSIKG